MLQKKEERELEQKILSLADLLIENTIATSMLVGEAQKEQKDTSIAIVMEMSELLEEYLGGHAEHLETLLQQLTQQKLPDENVLESFGEFRNHLNEVIQEGLLLYQNQPVEEVQFDPVTIEDSLPELEEDANILAFTENENIEEIPDTELANNEENKEPDEYTDYNDYWQNEMDERMESTIEDSIEPLASDLQEQWDLALKHVFPDTLINKDYSVKGITFSYYMPDLSLAIDTNPSEMRESVWKEYYCKEKNILHLSLSNIEAARHRQLVRAIKRSIAQNAGHNYV